MFFDDISTSDLGPSSRITIKDSILYPDLISISELGSVVIPVQIPVQVPVPVQGPISVPISVPVSAPVPVPKGKSQCPSEQRAQWFVDPSSIQVTETKNSKFG